MLAGPLYLNADADAEDHARCREVLESAERPLIVPDLVVTEVAYLIGTRLGTHHDLPLGTVDASVIAMAERLAISTIVTLDERHFRVVRPAHVDAFTLVP